MVGLWRLMRPAPGCLSPRSSPHLSLLSPRRRTHTHLSPYNCTIHSFLSGFLSGVSRPGPGCLTEEGGWAEEGKRKDTTTSPCVSSPRTRRSAATASDTTNTLGAAASDTVGSLMLTFISQSLHMAMPPNMGLFDRNLHYGYVLKPEPVCKKDHHFYPFWRLKMACVYPVPCAVNNKEKYRFFITTERH